MGWLYLFDWLGWRSLFCGWGNYDCLGWLTDNDCLSSLGWLSHDDWLGNNWLSHDDWLRNDWLFYWLNNSDNWLNNDFLDSDIDDGDFSQDWVECEFDDELALS